MALTINPAGSGSVVKSPDKAAYAYGDVVQLTASANSGYTFSNWSGDAGGSTNPISITINGNKTVTSNFTANSYTLALAINPAGTGSVVKNPDKAAYAYGDVVQLTAAANSGYTFSNWSGDAGGSVNPVSVTINGNKTVTANFTANSYTLALTINPAGSGSVVKNPDKAAYGYGDVVQLTAAANSGYTFSNWSGDAGGSTNPISITINGNKTVTANFTANSYTLALTINPAGSGSVVKNPDKAAYGYGDVVQLTAAANSGYTFSNWSGDAGGSTNPISITINGNKTVTANFTANSYTLALTINPAGSGSVVKNPDKAAYGYGDVVQLTAAANSGYTFSNWSGDAGGSTNPISITINGNKTVTANFTANSYTLALTINPAGTGSVVKSPDKAAYGYGDVVQLTAAANSGYTFSNWSGDAGGSTNPISITINGNKTVTANFTANSYTLALTINPVGSGSVVKSPDKAAYGYGDVVQLTAAANSGYTFSNWSGDAGGSVNPVSITINGNKTVTANFTANSYTLALTINPAGSGSVVKNPDKATYGYGDVVQLTAAANSGYTFSNWSGDAGGSTNPISITINGNKTVTANFTANSYTLALTINPAGSGSVVKSPDKAAYGYGDVVQLTAAANSGYTFSNWSGDAGGSDQPG